MKSSRDSGCVTQIMHLHLLNQIENLRSMEKDKVDVTLLKQIVGFSRYMCNSRPDIGFSVGLVSRYMDEPKVSHMKDARRILRYLKGSLSCGILFPQSGEGK